MSNEKNNLRPLDGITVISLEHAIAALSRAADHASKALS